jgi:hypothetical protein
MKDNVSNEMQNMQELDLCVVNQEKTSSNCGKAFPLVLA